MAALEMTLSPHRFRHSLAVAKLSAELARVHGWDVEKARMAGLVHDCAKEWKPKALISHVRRKKLKVPELDLIVKTSPGLLHAYVSADVARRNGWIRDAAQIRAVAAHTLGADRMDVPEMIVFVADLAAYDRTFSEAASVRRTARRDLRAGYREALAVKLDRNVRKSKPIHPQAIRAWNNLLMGAHER